MSGWQDLISTSLIGTERRALPTPTTPGFPAPGELSGDTVRGAAQLLDRAALLVVARRAGQLPGHADPVAPASADSCPEASMAAGQRLARILSGEHSEVLPEWLDAAVARNKRAPGYLLPALLDRARRDRGLRSLVAAVGGPRVFWLAGLNPAWSFLATEPASAPRTEPVTAGPAGTGAGPAGTGAGGFESPADEPPQAQPIWEFGSLGERRHYLSTVRASDPAAATELITAAWEAATADEKAVYLTALADGLGRADEPLLERALDDRRLEVRQRAADLLSRVPGAAIGQRMAERAVSCLRVERGLRGTRLLAEPPSGCDAAMRRDGIIPRPPGGRDRVGERGWWLAEVLARTPLRTWPERFGMQPADIVVMRMDEWAPQVVAGWARAAIAQQDPDWARVLLGRGLARDLPGAGADPKMGPLPPEFPAGELISVLPPAEQAAVATVLASSIPDGASLLAVLSGVPGPWGEHLAAAVLKAAASQQASARETGWRSRAIISLYRLAVERLDPALAAPGGLVAGLADTDGDVPPELHELALTLWFRYEMLREFDE